MSSTTETPTLPEGAVYASTAQLAERYQVSAKYVRAHRHHLGAITLTEPGCKRPRLRFHIETADAWVASRNVAPPPELAAQTRRRRRAAGVTPMGAPPLVF